MLILIVRGSISLGKKRKRKSALFFSFPFSRGRSDRFCGEGSAQEECRGWRRVGGIAQREQKGVAGLVEPGDLSRYPRASGRRLCIYACFAGIACFLPITRHSTWHTTPGYGAPAASYFFLPRLYRFSRIPWPFPPLPPPS